MRLEELQKLRLAAEMELIRQLEDQHREAEEIALLAVEHEYQNTPIGRGVKAKAGEQLNRGIYNKSHAKKHKQKSRQQNENWVYLLRLRHLIC